MRGTPDVGGNWWQRGFHKEGEWSPESDPKEVKHAKAAKCALGTKQTLEVLEKSSFSDRWVGEKWTLRTPAGLLDRSG